MSNHNSHYKDYCSEGDLSVERLILGALSTAVMAKIFLRLLRINERDENCNEKILPSSSPAPSTSVMT